MRAVFVIVTLLLCSPAALAAPPPVAIPDTPAGKVLRAWLDAFNSGDGARIEAYCKKYQHPNPPAHMTAFARQIGGFELLAVRAGEPRRISLHVKEKNSSTTALVKLAVADGQPLRIADFSMRAV